jgi:hypothetical protein
MLRAWKLLLTAGCALAAGLALAGPSPGPLRIREEARNA